MEKLDNLFEISLKKESVKLIIKDYVENLLHVLRHNKNRNVFKDFTNKKMLMNEFESDMNDLTYQMWINSLDFKQKQQENNFKELVISYCTLENGISLDGFEQSYLIVKINEFFAKLKKECDDIAEFIYFTEMPIQKFDTTLYDKKLHRFYSILTLCLFIIPFFIYWIIFKIKVSKRKREIKKQQLTFYKKYYFKIAHNLDLLREKYQTYFENNNIKIDFIEEKINNATKWLNKAEKDFKKYKIKLSQINKNEE